MKGKYIVIEGHDGVGQAPLASYFVVAAKAASRSERCLVETIGEIN